MNIYFYGAEFNPKYEAMFLELTNSSFNTQKFEKSTLYKNSKQTVYDHYSTLCVSAITGQCSFSNLTYA
jgi:hypothetical protein